MKTLQTKLPPQQQPKGITRPSGMSDNAYKSMVNRNAMTVAKIQALRESLERGKGK